MCGRFTLTANVAEIIERFDIEAFLQEDTYLPNYNVAPSQSVIAIINNGTINKMGYLKWGLIPPWAKEPSIGYKMINARAETLTEKASYRNAYKKKRCLIIADSFYEWKRIDQKRKLRCGLNSSRIACLQWLDYGNNGKPLKEKQFFPVP